MDGNEGNGHLVKIITIGSLSMNPTQFLFLFLFFNFFDCLKLHYFQKRICSWRTEKAMDGNEGNGHLVKTITIGSLSMNPTQFLIFNFFFLQLHLNTVGHNQDLLGCFAHLLDESHSSNTIPSVN